MTTNHVALVSDTPSVSFADIANLSAAIQKQVTRDFGPLWEVNATVDAFPKLEAVPVDYWPVIVRDDINEPNVAGFHTDQNGQPRNPGDAGRPVWKPYDCRARHLREEIVTLKSGVRPSQPSKRKKSIREQVDDASRSAASRRKYQALSYVCHAADFTS